MFLGFKFGVSDSESRLAAFKFSGVPVLSDWPADGRGPRDIRVSLGPQSDRALIRLGGLATRGRCVYPSQDPNS